MRRKLLGCTLPLAVTLSSACSSSSNVLFTPASDDSGDNGSDATSNGSNANPSDAGPHCGAQACAASEVCCYGNAAMPACMASGACTGSFLACTSQGDCSGQTCCFAYDQTGTATEGGPPGRGGGRAAPGGTFTAQCQDSCDTASYRLCASDAECQTGETCGMGPYAEYCQMNPFGDGGFPMPPRNNVPDQ